MLRPALGPSRGLSTATAASYTYPVPSSPSECPLLLPSSVFPSLPAAPHTLHSTRHGGLPPAQKRLHLGWDLEAKLLSPGDETEQGPILPSPSFLKASSPPATSLWAEGEAPQPPASSPVGS